MTPLRPLARLAAIGAAFAAVLTLGGCITLLPDAEPVALYRFEAIVQPQDAPQRAPYGLMRTPVTLPNAAAGDRILTVTGAEAAYISGARWVSPASVLFGEAVDRAFADYPPLRLAERGDLNRPDYVLRLDVATFETRYLAGPDQPPTVVVHLNALLSRTSDRVVVASRSFEARETVSENRVTAIVAAYDKATSAVITEMINWVGQSAR